MVWWNKHRGSEHFKTLSARSVATQEKCKEGSFSFQSRKDGACLLLDAAATRNITSSNNKCASLQPVTQWRLCILSAGREFTLICSCGSRGGGSGGRKSRSAVVGMFGIGRAAERCRLYEGWPSSCASTRRRLTLPADSPAMFSKWREREVKTQQPPHWFDS